jgi:cell division protein FtsQ
LSVKKNKAKRNRYVKKKGRMAKRLAFPGKTMAILSIVTLMGFSFIFCHDLLTQCDYFKAKRIIVKGAHKISRKQVLYQARISEGVNILSVNLSLTRNLLLAHPLVSNALVSREVPDGITIKITEHVSLAIIDLGRKFVVNMQGEIYKEQDETVPVNLPVISGLKFSDLNVNGHTQSILFNAVIQVLKLGIQPGSILPNSRVSNLEVDREMGITIYSLDQVKAVRIGYNNYKSKFDKLRRILLYVKKIKGFSRLESVDLSNLNRIIVNPVITKTRTHKEV